MDGVEMPSTSIYQNEKDYAKAIYVQEQINKALPLTEQKNLSKIYQEWIEERLAVCDVPAHLEEDVTQSES